MSGDDGKLLEAFANLGNSIITALPKVAVGILLVILGLVVAKLVEGWPLLLASCLAAESLKRQIEGRTISVPIAAYESKLQTTSKLSSSRISKS
jgi:hypothetical protein